MKRWQIEQILYLNKLNKRKLALPASHSIWHNEQSESAKKESIVVSLLRKLITFIRKTF